MRHVLVDVEELADRRGESAGRVQASELPRLAASVAGDAPLGFSLRGYRDELGRAAASLRIEGELPLRCDRCGLPVGVPLTVDTRYFFVASERALNAIPVEDDEVEPLVGGRAFDVTALVEDEAILALPISPRHETCPGAADEEASPPLQDVQDPPEAPVQRKRGS